MEALIFKVISYRDLQLKVAVRGKWKSESAGHSVMSDFRLTGPSVHGILQERILENTATSFSRGSSWPKDQTQVSCTVATRETPSLQHSSHSQMVSHPSTNQANPE